MAAHRGSSSVAGRALLAFFLTGLLTYSLSFKVFSTPAEVEEGVFDLGESLPHDLPPEPPAKPWAEAWLGWGGTRRRATAALTSRACGSPAVDGYKHVKPECLLASPTAKWWNTTAPRPGDLDLHLERRADYDGLAVVWGIGHKKDSLEACAEACRAHVPKGDGPFGWLPCNAFTWCSEDRCFEPDAHEHTKGDCWLKFTEAPAVPEVNMRGKLSAAMRQRHPNAPEQVPWHSGVLLPRGVDLKNGTWSPRADW